MDEQSPQNYTPQWETLRRYETAYYVTWLGGAVLALVLSVHFRALEDVFGFLWIAAFFAVGSLKGRQITHCVVNWNNDSYSNAFVFHSFLAFCHSAMQRRRAVSH